MKLLIIADGRSPITRSWIDMLQPTGIEIILVSSYPCETVENVLKQYTLPLAFAQFSGSQAGTGSTKRKKNGLVARFRPLAQRIRHLLGPWSIILKRRQYIKILRAEKPDLVHAMRIPFEGMLASYTPVGISTILSTWGNDLTLHANSSQKMASMTRRALKRADVLIVDVQRDVSLAKKWGFDHRKTALVAPANGGLDVDELLKGIKGIRQANPPQIINPRGMRSYVRNETFFNAIPLVLEKYPAVQFVCPSMNGQTEAEEWVQRLGLQKNVTLLPLLTPQQLRCEFAKSQISVSVTTHDGTPITLIEAMALGCLPICGDLESIREWITSGENGLLVDPGDPKALASNIIKGLDESDFRIQAALKNSQIIRGRIDTGSVRARIKNIYDQY